MKNKARYIYDILMISLVIITILTLWVDHEVNSMVNLVVWLVFLVDYLVRILTAPNKWQFIQKNPFLLLAVIPLDQFFQVARIVRVIYLFRIKTITKYYVTPYLKNLSYVKKILLGSVVPIIVVINASVIWLMNNSLTTWIESLVVTAKHLFVFANSLQTVNHFPTIILLTLTSIVGVIIQGLVLQWLFDRMAELWSKRKEVFPSSNKERS
ncbi:MULTISPECIES: transporter [Gracilibacillus]|uniref:transporter n=1 Tax=Gracilibacillus TaxID=74385 RepID=UPI0008265D74|nr:MULTISPECIES: transporter [Gracilibacillus]